LDKKLLRAILILSTKNIVEHLIHNNKQIQWTSVNAYLVITTNC